jgi:YidC/Oxa1 family membrane protein insertase
LDRRYINFMIAVVLILGTYMGLQILFPPPQRVAKKGNQKAVAAKDKDKDKDKQEKQAQAKAGGPAAAKEQAPGEKPAALQPPAGLPNELVFLGSVDAASGYALGVTLNTMGAAVERAELASEDYRDIDDASGYLAHLGLVDAEEGIRISVVGPGTPAALAKESSGKVAGGLAPGDIITSIGGAAVADAAAVETYLTKKTHPGDGLEIKTTRLINGKSTPLTFTASLTRRPVQVIRPESRVQTKTKFVERDPLSFLLTLESLGKKSIEDGDEEIRGLPSTINRNWNLDKQTADSAQFSLILDAADLKSIGETGSLKLIKRYKVAKSETPGGKNYHLDLEIEIQNVGPGSKYLAYRFSGPTGLPLEGWWYSNKLHREMWAAAGARDIAWKIHDGQHHLLAAPKIYSEAQDRLAKEDPAEQALLVGDDDQSLDHVGGDSQFFAAILLPQANGETPVTFARAFAKPVQDITQINKSHIKTLNSTCVLVSPAKMLEPGQALSTKFQVFLGPKDQSILEQYNLESLIERGWSYASYPASLLQLVLHGLFWLTGNYGISIFLLTVLVRSCMIPLSLKQAKSAAKMQELAPEMAKLKEKYKDDMEKQSTALRELYAKHKFNPFGGCLPVFLQLPIFVGLYRCLSVDIALRDADLFPGFFWASNLAGPDRLFFWKDWMIAFLADETAWLGPFFNVLPVVTCLLFIVQQKLFTPPATDEATAMQQKMMSYMTIIMGVMFFKVPAGLCIYFITSSLWSIAERKLIIKQKPVPAPPGDEKSGGNGGKDSRPPRPASPNGAGGNGTTKKVKN